MASLVRTPAFRRRRRAWNRGRVGRTLRIERRSQARHLGRVIGTLRTQRPWRSRDTGRMVRTPQTDRRSRTWDVGIMVRSLEMGRLLRRPVVLPGLFAALAVGGVVVIVVAARRAMKRSAEPVGGAPMRALRGFVVHRFDPIVMRLGLAGGAHSPWGLIEYVGRTSGRLYRTPVWPRRIEGGYEFPLPYGTDVQWVKNVQASGQARIQYHDTIVELDRPEIVDAQDAASVPDTARGLAQRLGDHYLRLHTVAEMPGDFAHGEGHPAALTHGDTFPMTGEGAFDATFLAPAGVEVPVEPQMIERAPVEPEASAQQESERQGSTGG